MFSCFRPIVLTALLCSIPVHAAQLSDVTGSVEDVILSGQVDVPLFTTPSGDPAPCIEVRIHDETYLFQLHPGVGIHLGARAVEALDPDIREKNIRHHDGSPVHYTDIDRISIGGLELQGVRATTDAPQDTDPQWANPYRSADMDDFVDGILGLQSLPGVAWAILPSTGTVSFAPEVQGAALLSQLQATAVPYRTTPEVMETYGKGNRLRMPAMGPIVPVRVGDQSASLTLSFSHWETLLRADLELPESAVLSVGDRTATWLPVQLGDSPVVPDWVLDSGRHQMLADPAFALQYPDGQLGYRVLAQHDMAVDPQNQRIAFRRAATPLRQDPLSFLLEAAQAKTHPEDDTPVDPAAWTRLGALLSQRGQLAEAIDAFAQPLDEAEFARQCMPWLVLGEHQLQANLIDDAIVSFETSSSLYHEWWDRPQDERETLAAEVDGHDGETPAPHVVQPGACHVADGRLAAAHMASGDTTSARAIYEQQLDLDADLAVVGGTAALLEGDLSTAQSAYRQAIQLRNDEGRLERAGLALAYAASGDLQSAENLYAAALAAPDADSMMVLMWVDMLTRTKSADAALQAALTYRRQHPDLAVAYVAIARTARQAGNRDEMYRVTGAGDRFFARSRALYPHSASLTANHAMFLLETNRQSEATQLAEHTLLTAPNHPLLWVTLGTAAVLRGEVARGENLLQRAGQIAPMHPGYALLIDAAIPTADATDPSNAP